MEENDTVSINIMDFDNNRKMLYNGSSFGECLKNKLSEFIEYGFEEEYKIINNEIKTWENLGISDILEATFIKYIELSLDFSNNLKRLDILAPAVFTPKNDIGKAIILLAQSCDLIFFLYKKRYELKNNLTLTFMVSHEDYEYEGLEYLS